MITLFELIGDKGILNVQLKFFSQDLLYCQHTDATQKIILFLIQPVQC